MYEAFKHAHSGLRWAVLIFLIIAIVGAFMKWQSKAAYTPKDKMIALLTLIFTHIQLLLGFVLYFFSDKVTFGAGMMKDGTSRFYTVEHVSMMLVAIVLITAGYSMAKRIPEDNAPKKFKTIFTFYLIGLVLILVSIPWPPRFGAGWF